MSYEIRKDEAGFFIYRIGPLGDRAVWAAVDRSWETSKHSATHYVTENSVKETVRRNKFFPCVIVQEEILPEPESVPEGIPTITFKDLKVDQKFIYFCGSDDSDHYVFKKINASDAVETKTGFVMRKARPGPVIKVDCL